MIALAGFLSAHIFVIAGAIALVPLFANYHLGRDVFGPGPHNYSSETRSTTQSAPREAAQ